MSSYQFHVDRLRKMLVVAHKRFKRADQYLSGRGFFKESSAHGATEKAHGALKEAIWNAHQAIKLTNGDADRLMKTKAVVNAFRKMDGAEFFVDERIAETWDKAIGKWCAEFDRLLPTNNTAESPDLRYHYTFSHRALPTIVHSGPNKLFSMMARGDKKRVITDLLRAVCDYHDYVLTDQIISEIHVDLLRLPRQAGLRIGRMPAVIIRMPEPSQVPWALYRD